MLNVLLTKKNAQLLSAFHIIHFTASTLRDTGYLINTYIQSPFLQPHDFDFFSYFLSWHSTDCAGLHQVGINTFDHTFSYHSLSLQS